MPNWTSNTLTIVSENMDLLAKVEHEITSVEKDEFTGKTIRLIDFNRIVPMPKTIDTDTVGCEADSFRYYCLKSGKGMLKDYSRYFSERKFQRPRAWSFQAVKKEVNFFFELQSSRNFNSRSNRKQLTNSGG